MDSGDLTVCETCELSGDLRRDSLVVVEPLPGSNLMGEVSFLVGVVVVVLSMSDITEGGGLTTLRLVSPPRNPSVEDTLLVLARFDSVLAKLGSESRGFCRRSASVMLRVSLGWSPPVVVDSRVLRRDALSRRRSLLAARSASRSRPSAFLTASLTPFGVASRSFISCEARNGSVRLAVTRSTTLTHGNHWRCSQIHYPDL